MTDSDPAAGQDKLAALAELERTHGEPLIYLDRLVLLAADICGAHLACFTVHDATKAYEVSATFDQRATMPKQECMCTIPLSS